MLCVLNQHWFLKINIVDILFTLSLSLLSFFSSIKASSSSFLSKAILGGEAPSSLAYSLVDSASPLLFSFAFRCISMV